MQKTDHITLPATPIVSEGYPCTPVSTRPLPGGILFAIKVMSVIAVVAACLCAAAAVYLLVDIQQVQASLSPPDYTKPNVGDDYLYFILERAVLATACGYSACFLALGVCGIVSTASVRKFPRARPMHVLAVVSGAIIGLTVCVFLICAASMFLWNNNGMDWSSVGEMAGATLLLEFPALPILAFAIPLFVLALRAGRRLRGYQETASRQA